MPSKRTVPNEATTAEVALVAQPRGAHDFADLNHLPDFLGYRPPLPPRAPRASILVFTDTMEAPSPTCATTIRFKTGRRVSVEACPPSPIFPGVYLLALRNAGYVLARLVPMIGGGFHVRYDNPVYDGFTVWPHVAREHRALCRIVGETPSDYGAPN